jgi:hypothetical protein
MELEKSAEQVLPGREGGGGKGWGAKGRNDPNIHMNKCIKKFYNAITKPFLRMNKAFS